MRVRAEGTPNRGSVALDALCRQREEQGEYGVQSKLAKELDADEGQFSRWRRGVRKPDVPKRMKMQERFGIPALDWDEEPAADDASPDSASHSKASEGAA